MKKIIVFGASTSRSSINKKFASWAASLLKSVQLEILDLNDFEMPIYSIDRERENGIPKLALDFKNKIKEADAIIISLAEHNGSYTAAFKNITDWVSRIEKGTWADKPILLLSTSPGQRGAQGVLSAAINSFPYQGAKIIGSFSLPSFHQNFNEDKGIIDSNLKTQLKEQLKKLEIELTI